MCLFERLRKTGADPRPQRTHSQCTQLARCEHNGEKAQCSAERIQRRRAFLSQRADPATSPFLGQLAVEATPAEVGAARAVAR